MNDFTKDKNISWLNTAPSGEVAPPLNTKEQELPFEKLQWEDFEKLCLRLIRLESDVQSCRQYGVRGNKQHGIDIYARGSGFDKYRVYQCKNEGSFGPQKIKNAVKKYKSGDWFKKSSVFVLCTRESLQARQRANTIEEQTKILAQDGKELICWDKPELSIRLKANPELVNDFFGKAWVERFCGHEAIGSLGGRLDAKKHSELRSRLFSLYDSAFNIHDRGIPIPRAIPLIERCVIPDIQDIHELLQPSPNTIPERMDQAASDQTRPSEGIDRDKNRFTKQPISDARYYKQRIPFQDWVAKNTKSMIFGEPGSGKTTLLRFLVLDLLSQRPVLDSVSEKWGYYLPIWIPFALWTKMISDQGAGDPGLGGIVERWLTAWNSKELIPLVEEALHDKRLLLLIDGLDEYADKQSAEIALNHLEHFLSQNPTVAVITTTRPGGYKKLNREFGEWSEAEIAPFSYTQQHELTQIWFSENLKKTNPNLGDTEKLAEIKKQTENFFRELKRSKELRQLSTNPLLLSLLIYLHISNLRLPLSRFNAYASLVEHLIVVHPFNRKVAAEVPKKSVLTSENVKNILANLAYVIHKRFPEGLVEQTTAEQIVKEFLQDGNIGLGMDSVPALQIAKKTVSVVEDEFGLLVKKSQTEISFYHRTLQEYLAAFHLFRLSPEEQAEAIRKYCTEPLWKEIILGLFQINKRPKDVEGWIQTISIRRNNVALNEKLVIDTLLSEIVFGDFNCPPNLVKKVASAFFSKVQNASWLPYKQRILKNVLNGLESPVIKNAVQEQVSKWFPDRVGWKRPYLIDAMTKWRFSNELKEMLFTNLRDPDERVRSSAAATLGVIAKGNDEVKGQLLEEISNALDLDIIGSCSEALIIGWKESVELPPVLNRLVNSASPSHKLIGIKGRVELGIHADDDLKSLLSIGHDRSGLYLSGQIIAETLVKGWPKSTVVKKACLAALSPVFFTREAYLDKAIALQVLLEGYPMDDDVAEYCIAEVEREKNPFLIHSIEAFTIIAKNFRGHEKLIAALDKWVQKVEHEEPEVSCAALVGRTNTFKKILLEDLTSSPFVHWPAKGLLDGWGMSDPEVSGALLEFVHRSLKNASAIGHLLPEIIEDKKECRSLLLKALKSSECERYDFLMEGLLRLGNTDGDTEVVDTVLPILAEKEMNFTDGLKSGLIKGYSFDPRVREYALKTLSERDGPFSAIAYSFGDDKEIRDKIIEILTPLPTPMRLTIAEHLSETEGDEAFTLSLLDLYDLESDEEVKVQASIGYHSKLRCSSKSFMPALERLKKTIVCYGPDYQERRQAAFCGLVILGRLDVMVDAKERIGSERIVGIDTIKGIGINVPLYQFILENWDYLKCYFKADFWERIFRYNGSSYYTWKNLAQFADKYESPKKELLEFLLSYTPKVGDSNLLLFLSRVVPKSEVLWHYCLNTLELTKPEEAGEKRDPNIYLTSRDKDTAIDIIRTNFSSGEKYLNRIDITGNKHNFEVLLQVLADIWPRSEELSNLLDELQKSGRRCTCATAIRFFAIRAGRPRMFREICRVIRKCLNKLNFVQHETLYSPIVRRLQNDNLLCNLLIKYINITPNPSLKISIARLIHQAIRLTPELKDKLNTELSRQLPNTVEEGYDIVSGNFVSIPHAIFKMLETD